MSDNDERTFCFAIDRGGTFTDVYCFSPQSPGWSRTMKLLSEDPENYVDAPREGIRRILEEETGVAQDKSCVDSTRIEWIRMGTTVATNALLERKGERVALFITAGFENLLQIGNQARPFIFDLEIVKPDLLYEQVVEVNERVQLVGQSVEDEDEDEDEDVDNVHVGVTGERVRVLRAPDKETTLAQLQDVYDSGVRSIAVLFMHSYTYDKHEQQVGAWAREVGFEHVSLSSALMPMVRAVPRGHTSCVDAYLTPVIRKYIESFQSGFDEALSAPGANKVSFMQSDGGLAPVQQFTGYRAILSGPAGGVVGYALTTYNQETGQPVIGFDMGGTSTDVSRYDGRLEHVFENTTAGVTIQAPQLDINTVAAGGGSRLFFRSGMFVVGPESAGAHPGPVCYRKGGHLAVTDANLLLGRIIPDYFPHIFGEDEKQPLDVEATRAAFDELTDEINAAMDTQMSAEEVALGFIKVANAAMARPVRNLTEAKGHDVSKHVLACFGGAGPQHACEIARDLGMSKVFVHKNAGILSAYGIALADIVFEAQEPCALVYTEANVEEAEERLTALRTRCVEQLHEQGVAQEDIEVEMYLNIRYQGTDTSIMTLKPGSDSDNTYADSFLAQYEYEYGFTLPERDLLIDDVRVRAIGKSGTRVEAGGRVESDGETEVPQPVGTHPCYFDQDHGFVDTPIYKLGSLEPGCALEGPAFIMESTFTTVLLPGCTAHITAAGNIEIDIALPKDASVDTSLDSIQLSIFAHRFMSIAEQMGRTLQRTSISTNIKERLDFSCAIFGPDGGLVANAPHLPVHLGSMSEAVRWQIENAESWQEGEVLVTNHPVAGGSHLPDITVISPVYNQGQPVFYVASRGHHADIGSIASGSMPPFSKTLEEEGACIKSFKLVRDGVFQEEGITELLMAPGKLPVGPTGLANSGTRNLRDNLSDLRAQVAANNKGIQLTQELMKQYGIEVVQAYMGHVQDNAELAVRDTLKSISLAHGLGEVDTLHCRDYMDDGTAIDLKLTIDRREGSAEFDFEDSGPEVWGNCNAPTAVTLAAILYSLRCLVDMDIPLNHGCLKPITVKVPPNSILSPSDHAAVVGGNVLTSQRVTDVILSAFGACANSQGCMNNLTFGDDSFGYYETIAGGAGAGPTWHGQSGVQTHMTNTRITDVEVLERRYPVLVREFGLRHGSGGAGQHRGGDGVVRDLEFLRTLTVSILSERRSLAPQGIAGGHDGERGVNLLLRTREQRTINLGGKGSVQVEAGDRIRILTPGGGGYGQPKEEEEEEEEA